MSILSSLSSTNQAMIDVFVILCIGAMIIGTWIYKGEQDERE